MHVEIGFNVRYSTSIEVSHIIIVGFDPKITRRCMPRFAMTPWLLLLLLFFV